MRALFLTKYGSQAASTRHRFLQYLPMLEEAGIRVSTSALLDDAYLGRKFEDGTSSFTLAARGYARRLQALLGAAAYHVVVIHCELFPYVPAIFERSLRWRGIPYVLDFDDAIFHNYDQHRQPLVRALLGRKMGAAIQGASTVLAGNEYLAAYARQHNRHVEVLPTVVDPDRYVRERRPRQSTAFTIGWLGSPSTAAYVEDIQPALERFFARTRGRLVLVGSGPVTMPDVPIEVHRWSEPSEVDELGDFDVGIMPLPDTPWTRGKCGFKLIQYMAAGLPVVASPVGVNATLVDHGANGLLATTPDEWVHALTGLERDDALRTTMGEAGRQRVALQYSLRATAPRLIRVLQEAAVSRR
jgi:glycosyltransferase involved in cell wall biosynthesis